MCRPRWQQRHVPATPDGTRGAGARGVTLVELVVALSLLALVVGSIYGFVATGSRSAAVTNEFLRTQAQVRAALDNVTDEARWARAVVAASATAVTLAIPAQTPFSSGSPYTVTFAYDAAARTLTRQEDGGPAQPIAYDVVREDGSGGLAFEYFDASGASLGTAPADLSSVARIRITVSTTRGGTSRTFTADVAIRAR
jgi:prepilin-type N-terminal cleavage/methylation domain-containing protein